LLYDNRRSLAFLNAVEVLVVGLNAVPVSFRHFPADFTKIFPHAAALATI
jgi:hypothetical protein